MKYSILALTVLGSLTISGCRLVGVCLDAASCTRDEVGKPNDPAAVGECKGSRVIGEWTDGLETVVFKDNCQYTNSRCQNVAKFSRNTELKGKFDFQITAIKVVDKCPPLGEKLTCSYEAGALEADPDIVTELKVSCLNSDHIIRINRSYRAQQ